MSIRQRAWALAGFSISVWLFLLVTAWLGGFIGTSGAKVLLTYSGVVLLGGAAFSLWDGYRAAREIERMRAMRMFDR